MSNVLIVMAGLPGTGKSTFVHKQLLNFLGGDTFVFSTDDWIENKAKELGKTYSEIFQDYVSAAHSEMYSSLEKAIENNFHIVWDQTNLSRKKRRKILDSVPYSRNFCFYVPKPLYYDPVWRERLRNRPGKEIDEKVIKSMYVSYAEPSEDEGFEKLCRVDMVSGHLLDLP